LSSVTRVKAASTRHKYNSAFPRHASFIISTPQLRFKLNTPSTISEFLNMAGKAKAPRGALHALLNGKRHNKVLSGSDFVNNGDKSLHDPDPKATPEDEQAKVDDFEKRKVVDEVIVTQFTGVGRAHMSDEVAPRAQLLRQIGIPVVRTSTIAQAPFSTAPNDDDRSRTVTSASNPTRRPTPISPPADRPPMTRFLSVAQPDDSNWDTYADAVTKRWEWPAPSVLDPAARKRVQLEIDFIVAASNLRGSMTVAERKLAKLEVEVGEARGAKEWGRVSRLEADVRTGKGTIGGFEMEKNVLHSGYERSYVEEEVWADLEMERLWDMAGKKARKGKVMDLDEGQERLRGIKRGRAKSPTVATKKAKGVKKNMDDFVVWSDKDDDEEEQDLNELLGNGRTKRQTGPREANETPARTNGRTRAARSGLGSVQVVNEGAKG
jgi:hypothetical protein